MELSVLTPVPGTGGHRLQLQRGSWALAAEFSVCDNPCCSCAEIQFSCSPENGVPAVAPDDRGPFRFALDVLAHGVATDGAPLDLHPGLIDLANAVAAELTPEDWQALLQYFLAVKRKPIGRAALKRLRPVFQPEILSGRESMVGYVEVFPFDAGFEFDVDGEAWFADDQYCVRSGCPCENAVLSFLRVPTTAPSATMDGKDAPAIRYGYRTGAIEELARPRGSSPTLDVLVASLRRAHPDLHVELESRHGQLRVLFERARRKSLPPPPAEPAPRRLEPTSKTGRNDPCPCGSGRKFKKCCGGS